MGEVMSQAKKPIPTRPSQTASPSRPQTRASAPKQVTFNPEPVTIPSSLPAAAGTTPADTSSVHPPEVKGTIPVTDAANPSKVKNVLVSVTSPIAPADPATTDHNSTAKSDKPSEPSANEPVLKQNGKPFPTANGSSDDTTSNEDEEEVIKEAAGEMATPVTAAAVNNNAALLESPSSLKRARGRPRKNMPQLLSTPVSPPKAAAATTAQTTPMSIDKIRRRGRGCGNCPGCLRDDCGKCSYCLDKPKFGGPGKKKQRCALRICSNFVSASPFRLPMMASGDLQLPISFTAQRSAPGVKNAVHTPEAAAVIAPSVSSLESIINTPIIIQKQESLLVPSENNAAAVAASKEETTNAKAPEDQPSQTETKPDASPLPSKQPEGAASSSSSTTSPSQSASKAKQGSRSVLSANMEMMKCCMCGRDRKVTIARSSKFCTQRCLNKWKELNPRQDPENAEPHDNPTTLLQVMPPSESDKSTPRAIRNLSINMAFPGTVLQRAPSPDLPSPTSAQPTQASVNNGLKRPATQEEPAVPAKKSALAANMPAASSSIAGGKAPKKKSQFDLPLNIDKWTVRDVSRYFEATPECCQYAPIFSEQEVDGTALLLLTHDSLVKCLGIKLGPALKVMTHVDRLKAQKQALS